MPSHFVEEWLLSYPQGRERVLFRRSTERKSAEYNTKVKASVHFDPESAFVHSARKRTRENSLFLAVVAQDNVELAANIQKWFASKVTVVDFQDGMESLHAMGSAQWASESPDFKKDLLRLIRIADPNIIDIVISQNDEDHIKAVLDRFPEATRRLLAEGSRYRVDFTLKSGDEIVVVPLTSQSRGVRKLFSLSARLTFALYLGEVLVIDEIERSMHPHLARFLVDLFQNQSTNVGNGQIIFTTHDTNLLDQSLLRRDQIWFVEKEDCCSRLYPLLDYSPRKDENLEAGYLRGRYGAIPALGMVDWLTHSPK